MLVATQVVAWAALVAGVLLAAGLWQLEGRLLSAALALLAGILCWALFRWCYAALQDLAEIRQHSGALLQALKQLGSGPFYDLLEQGQRNQTRFLREILARLQVKEKALRELEERMDLELADKDQLRKRLEAEKESLKEALHRLQLKEEDQLRERLKQQAAELQAESVKASGRS